MIRFAFCNGKIIREDEPCISLNDRGFLFGDGVFTTLKVEGGLPQYFEDHIRRLKEHCEKLHIEAPVILLEDVQKLILKNDAMTGVWRLKIILTGGEKSELQLNQRKYGKLLMTLNPVVDFKTNLKLIVYPKPISTPLAGLKTLSYLDRLFLMDYASSHQVDDVITLSLDGFIMEAAFSNIFWIKDMDFFTPDPQLGFLFGIQLSKTIEQYEIKGYRIHFVQIKPESIPTDVQIFICNSIKGVVPVSLKS